MAFPDVASSATLVFNLDTLFSAGSAAPSASTPWLTVTAKDVGETVELTFTAPGLTGSEYVDDWYMNLAVEDFNKVGYSRSSAIPTTFVEPTIKIGSNAFVAGPDGSYGLFFDFANGGGDNARFGSNGYDELNNYLGDSVIYTFTYTGAGDFNAESFNVDSAPGSGPYGPYRSAAKVNAIPNPTDPTGSAWIAAIPEPSAGLLGMLTVTVWSVCARRRGLVLPKRK
jgi:hypothetical protein